MSDQTPATGEAARGIDLDIVERAAHDVRENGLLGCVPGNEHAISTATVLALVARVRSDEARVKELEDALRPFADAADLFFEGDEHLVVSGTNLSIGDLRCAARLLSGGVDA